MRRLSGRVAILTGASRGLGPYIARALAAEGIHLVLGARALPQVEAVAAEVRTLGVKAVAVGCDVCSESDRAALVRATLAEFGRIDILVNNAGIELTAHFEQLPEEDLGRVIEVNLTSAMKLTHLVQPSMLERRSGHVLNIASMVGKMPIPFSVPYVASKAGLIGFTESFRSEFRSRGVSASVICPSFVSEAGMYKTMQDDSGVKENIFGGTVSPAKVASDVVKALKRDRPEMLVYRGPARMLSGFAELTPGLFERTFPLFGVTKLFEDIADAREKQESREPVPTADA